jgi:toxin HigB-1
VIRSFKSRALKALWEKDDRSKLDTRMTGRILRRLDSLHAATKPENMNRPGFDFHPLTGSRKGTYSIHINGPWCITFEWDDTDAIRVDLEQYH